jgi:hypothetical protein
MSGDEANVGSIDAVREFRAVMATFMHESHDALTTFDLESRRALEWLTDTAPKYWESEHRKCQDRIVEAKIAYQTCKAQKLPGGGEPACLEEKKVLDRARAQLLYIEEKQAKTKKWGAVASRQALEYKGRSNQLQSVLDAQLPNALALLDRVLNSLEAYIGLQHTKMEKRYEDMLPTAVAQPGDEADPAKPQAAEQASGEGQAVGEAATGEENAPASANSAEAIAENHDSAPADAMSGATSAHTES